MSIFQFNPFINSTVETPLSEEEQLRLNLERADRSLFVQELLLGTLQQEFVKRMNEMKLSSGLD